MTEKRRGEERGRKEKRRVERNRVDSKGPHRKDREETHQVPACYFSQKIFLNYCPVVGLGDKR